MGNMRIHYKKELYSRNILFRTCYAFTDQAYIHLDADADSYIVTISPKEEGDQTDYARLFSNRMIEEENREIVVEQTQNLRQILFARAMASTMIYDEEIADIDTDVSDKSAMKDWFAE